MSLNFFYYIVISSLYLSRMINVSSFLPLIARRFDITYMIRVGNNIGNNFGRYRAERLFCVAKNEMTCNLIKKSQINYENIVVFIQQHYNIIQFVFLFNTHDI